MADHRFGRQLRPQMEVLVRHRFLAVSMCVLFAAAPPAAHAQSAPDPANDPALLQLFGLQNAYVVDGKSKPLTAIADEQAARVEAERAAAAAAAPPPPAPLTAAAPPPPAATSAPTVPEAAGTVWNFVRRFVSVCGSGWRSKQHACYADVTSGTPQHWNSPPTAASPEPVGFLDSDATPPPLLSVKTPGAVHPAQIVLTDQIAALTTGPNSGPGSPSAKSRRRRRSTAPASSISAMTTSPHWPSARASHRRSFISLFRLRPSLLFVITKFNTRLSLTRYELDKLAKDGVQIAAYVSAGVAAAESCLTGQSVVTYAPAQSDLERLSRSRQNRGSNDERAQTRTDGRELMAKTLKEIPTRGASAETKPIGSAMTLDDLDVDVRSQQTVAQSLERVLTTPVPRAASQLEASAMSTPQTAPLAPTRVLEPAIAPE